MDKNAIFLGIINSFEEYIEINKDILQEDIVTLYKNEFISISEEEIKQYFGNYKNIKELRNKAYTIYKEKIQGNNIDIDKYKNIRISRQSAERYKYYGADDRKLLIVPKLLDILKTSVYKNSSGRYKKRTDDIIKFHYFINKVRIKNIIYEIYITIGEDEKGNLFYDLDENKEP